MRTASIMRMLGEIAGENISRPSLAKLVPVAIMFLPVMRWCSAKVISGDPRRSSSILEQSLMIFSPSSTPNLV